MTCQGKGGARLQIANQKLGTRLARGGIEYYYHTGQIRFIRLATDPDWDYGATVYADV